MFGGPGLGVRGRSPTVGVAECGVWGLGSVCPGVRAGGLEVAQTSSIHWVLEALCICLCLYVSVIVFVFL